MAPLRGPVTLKGDTRTLRSLKKALQRMPITVSARIAARAAPEISALAGSAYDAGKTVYGAPRPRGVDGDELTLQRTGASRRAMRFAATGRDIRTAQLPRHTRYLIGKYDVLPNGPLPTEWRARLAAVAAEELAAEIAGVK